MQAIRNWGSFRRWRISLPLVVVRYRAQVEREEDSTIDGGRCGEVRREGDSTCEMTKVNLGITPKAQLYSVSVVLWKIVDNAAPRCEDESSERVPVLRTLLSSLPGQRRLGA